VLSINDSAQNYNFDLLIQSSKKLDKNIHSLNVCGNDGMERSQCLLKIQ